MSIDQDIMTLLQWLAQVGARSEGKAEKASVICAALAWPKEKLQSTAQQCRRVTLKSMPSELVGCVKRDKEGVYWITSAGLGLDGIQAALHLHEAAEVVARGGGGSSSSVSVLLAAATAEAMEGKSAQSHDLCARASLKLAAVAEVKLGSASSPTPPAAAQQHRKARRVTRGSSFAGSGESETKAATDAARERFAERCRAARPSGDSKSSPRVSLADQAIGQATRSLRLAWVRWPPSGCDVRADAELLKKAGDQLLPGSDAKLKTLVFDGGGDSKETQEADVLLAHLVLRGHRVLLLSRETLLGALDKSKTSPGLSLSRQLGVDVDALVVPAVLDLVTGKDAERTLLAQLASCGVPVYPPPRLSMAMEHKDQYMRPLMQARLCPPTTVYYSQQQTPPSLEQLKADASGMLVALATLRRSRVREHKAEGFWVKGSVSGNGDLVAWAPDLVTTKAHIKELLCHQPAVLVQPHVRELASVQYRVLVDPARGRPVATFALEPALSSGELCVTELVCDTEDIIAAARHLPLLLGLAQVTHQLLSAKVEEFKDWAPIYGIDMAVIECEDGGGHGAIVNEVQVSHDTSLFANETSYPVIEAQARHVENLLLKLVMLSDERKTGRADTLGGSGACPFRVIHLILSSVWFAVSTGFRSFGVRRWPGRLVADCLFGHAKAHRF